MSLQSLTNLRRSGGAPAAVWVVVGKCPASVAALPDCIAVTGNPVSMDWRPVVGLHVDIFDLSGDDALLDATIGAVEAANPKAVGVACDHATLGLSEQHENAMHQIRRQLANHS